MPDIYLCPKATLVQVVNCQTLNCDYTGGPLDGPENLMGVSKVWNTKCRCKDQLKYQEEGYPICYECR